MRTVVAERQAWSNERGVNELLYCTGVLGSVNVVSALFDSVQMHLEILCFIVPFLQQFLAPKGAVESASVSL